MALINNEYDNFGNKVSTITPDSSVSNLGSSNLAPPPGMIGDIVNDPTAPNSFLSGGATSNLQVEGVIKVGKEDNSAGVNTGIASSDIVFWAGSKQEDRDTAPFRVDLAGNLTANSATIAGVPLTQQSIYGDGSDLTTVITAGVTLNRDKFYEDMTVNSGVIVNTNGYRLFVNGTLTNAGTIRHNGGNGGNGTNGANGGDGRAGGAGGSAGAIAAAGSLPAGEDGKVGGAGGDGAGSDAVGGSGTAGTAGDSVAKSVGSAGVAGAGGGTGGLTPDRAGGPAGGAGAAGSQTGTVFNKIRNATSAYMLIDHQPSISQLLGSSGSGGSGGGGGGSGSVGISGDGGGGGGGGGGSGASGGFVSIFAKTLINSGTISANGGNGGNGANGGNANSGTGNECGGGGGGGAGSGGSGGVVVLVYGSLTNTGTISANGGSAGTIGTGGNGANGGNAGINGSAGNAGASGVVIQLQV